MSTVISPAELDSGSARRGSRRSGSLRKDSLQTLDTARTHSRSMTLPLYTASPIHDTAFEPVQEALPVLRSESATPIPTQDETSKETSKDIALETSLKIIPCAPSDMQSLKYLREIF